MQPLIGINDHSPNGEVIPVSPEQAENAELVQQLLAKVKEYAAHNRMNFADALREGTAIFGTINDRQKGTGAAVRDVLADLPDSIFLNTMSTGVDIDSQLPYVSNKFELLTDMSKVASLEQIAERLGKTVAEAKDMIAFARYASTPRVSKVDIIGESGEVVPYMVEFRSVMPVKNKFGTYRLYHVKVDDEWGDYYIMTQDSGFNRESLKMEFQNRKELLIRFDSGCRCGMTFLDDSCDCALQLHRAMEMITQNGEGMIVHIPGQDGRGMGFDGKAATEELKGRGFDTTEAAVHYYGSTKVDKRTYSGAYAAMHAVMTIPRDLTFNVMTNSEHKLLVIEENGHEVVTTPMIVDYHEDAKVHVNSKVAMGHRVDGQPLRPRKAPKD